MTNPERRPFRDYPSVLMCALAAAVVVLMMTWIAMQLFKLLMEIPSLLIIRESSLIVMG